MGLTRSKGVTFWGWALIVLGLCGLVLLALKHTNIIQGDGKGLFTYFILKDVAEITCGIFILQLKEVARKLFLCLLLINITMGFCFLPHYLNAQKELHKNSIILPWVKGGMFLLPIIPFLFFTRPKVKAQFR